jgi:hypothetical protein
MTQVFRYRDGEAAVWHRGSVKKSNQYCLYCSRFVGEGSPLASNKEHLIGRNFVPTGRLGTPRAFNFIFRACIDCNQEKSNYEGHVSTISLLTSPARLGDSAIDELAKRKADKDFHPDKPGMPVADAGQKITIRLGSSVELELKGPPRLNPAYVRVLAMRHIQGLFALVTTSDPGAAATTRLLPKAHFGFFNYFNHPDWGNPQLIELAKRVGSWPALVDVSTAAGFFRAILRRQGVDDAPWFWALEWNKSVRVIGWIGRPDMPPSVFEELPPLNWRIAGKPGESRYRVREEIPLLGVADELFVAKG